MVLGYEVGKMAGLGEGRRRGGGEIGYRISLVGNDGGELVSEG